MTATGLLARNTALNLLGLGAPMLVALVAIPVLLTGLGTERFGVLTISWMAIGYFSVFDLGLGRALTQQVAQQLGTGDEENVASIVWTAIPLMLLMGIVGMIVVAALAPWLVTGVLAIPEALVGESLRAFQILAISLPWVIVTAGLRGCLEAKQCFGMINAVRIPTGIFNYLGPLLVLPFSNSLAPIIALLAIARVFGCGVHVLMCMRAMPHLARRVAFDRHQIAPLLRFGGWMTVSNIVSPFMAYFDRFFIGAMVSMTAVAYYVTPYEVVMRLLLVPAALHGVLFPAMAETSTGKGSRTTALLDGGVRATGIALLPVVLIVVTMAPEALDLWLGPDFARNSATVLQLLAVGVFINSIAQLEFSAVQAVGHPEFTGKLHLAELPAYIALLWWAVSHFGIVGAAFAWTVRVAVDGLILILMVRGLLPAARRATARTVMGLGCAMALFGVATLPNTLGEKVTFLGVTLALFSIVAWRVVLAPSERAILLGRLKGSRRTEAELGATGPAR